MTRLNTKNIVLRRHLLKTMMGGSLLAVTGSVLTACSNSGPTYYTLSPIQGRLYNVTSSIIEVRTPSLAGFLDKDRIVSEISNNKLTLSSSDAWADNITNMIGRVLMLDLAQRLPNSRVFLQNQATQTTPQFYVEMDISRFNQDASGKAVVTADVVIRTDSDKPAQFNRLLTLEKVPADSSTQALVVALSQILGEIAETTAASLANLPSMPIVN
ncbi:PqiC family protein [Commensalibacter communis]|uniref:PqiC family protein n=1 Tax=Commensalibacter communis TaxID=2972786 RepID=UPI0022FF8FBA|nr:PqiC family protein [Commensalibacter communis]CAI3922237.1 Intermembrane transporter PqiABC lipoprotein subunit PqiC (PqiC) (PDB:6OSX) (PUBMED:27795327) [Commensalibacter communis]CAI3932900.1 Intermembrane transporter PqiABC lipoprotein subunit PqiC (PqiC) (PDB:6OSX) (PUBMED:27795327) [Commensalibacter communis]